MNAEMNSHQSELLFAYLDGELSSTEEQVLFAALAENDELRAELKDQLSIRDAIHADKEAFSPPLAATAAVFAGLGFSVPASASATMAPVPVPTPVAPPLDPVSTSAAGTFFGTAARPLIKPLLGAIVGSALTATVVTTVLDSGTNPSADIPAAAPPEPVLLVHEQPQTPVLSDVYIDVSQPPAVVGRKEVAIAAVDDRTAGDRTADARPVTIECRQPEVRHDAGEQTLITAAKEVERMMAAEFGDLQPKQDRFVLQLMNSPVLFSNPSSNMPSQSDPYMLNMRAGLFYLLDDAHSFGIEAGREAFAQSFSGDHRLGTAHYEQNPIAWWVSAAYRYKTGELTPIPGLRGFFQANAGAAMQLGPLGRGIVGLQYDVAPGILFQVGAEGSMLIYKLDKTYYTTRKLGLSYGFSLQF